MATTVLRVAATREDVFAVLADGWLYPNWVVGTSRMRAVDAEWPAAQARLHHSFGVWPLLVDDDTQLLEWLPPSKAVLEARGWPLGKATVELEVTPDGEGCQVRITENPNGGPALLIPKPVRDALIGVRNVESLRRLGFLAEGGSR